MKKLFYSKKWQKLLLACIFMFSSTFIFAQDFNILVFHKTNGFRHTGAINGSIDMLEDLGNNSAHDTWGVDETTDASVFTTANLAKYDVIVFSNTTGGDLLNNSQQAAMEAFIQSGKGFVGFHSATDTYRNDSPDAVWPWYNELVGAIVQANPNHTSNNLQGTMNVLANHPIISHVGTIGDTWVHNEEWYYWELNGGQLSDDNTVLLEVESTGNNSYDARRPITWLKEFDGGRSFYTALGHNQSTYSSNQTFREMVENAILWTANRLSSEDDCASLTSDWTDLLENDLDCWELWMGVPHSTTGLPGSSSDVTNGSGTPLGLENDPTNVFSVIEVNGEKQLYITGEVYGGLTTINEYGNYHLSMEFKWGEQKWEPRLNSKRDSGILYHCKGEHGEFWDVWKSSLEFQVQEGDCGDYIGLAEVSGLIPAVQDGNQFIFTPMATPVSRTRVRRSEDFENPNGEWNTLEVIVVGDRAIHYVNGNLVNAVVDATWNGASVTTGQIQIQSEAAEIFYRNIRIRATADFPEDDKVTLGWDDDNPSTSTCDTDAPIGEIIALRKSGGDQKWVTINDTNANLVANGDEADRELFYVEAHSNGCVALRSVTTDKYIQVNGNNTSTAIRANGDAPGTWENFGWEQKGNNQVALRSIFNNGWIQADWTVNNSTLFPLGNTDGDWETFDFVVISETVCDIDAPIGETIALRKSGGDQKWITVDGSTNVIANGEEADRELFVVESHTNGCVAFRALSNGKYLQVQGGNTNAVIKANGNAPGTWENFGWKSQANGQVSIQSLFNDGWIQASWAENNTSLYPRGTSDGNWETLDFVIVDPFSPITEAPIGATIALQKSGGDQKWVTVDTATNNLVANGQEADSALFVVEEHTDGSVALRSVATGKYIQVTGNNQNVEIKANGNAPGTWENFEWTSKGDNQVALRSVFNDGWIQASWAQNNTSLFPRGAADGTWETFNVTVVSEALGLDEKLTSNNDSEIVVYPNPSTGIVTVEGFSNTQKVLRVYDAHGRVMLRKNITSTESTEIDLAPLSKGIYLIVVGDQNQTIVKN